MRLFLAALAISSTPAFAEYIPGSDISIGNWVGAAYSSDETGQFSHCVVSAPYVSGDTLFLSVNGNATVTIGIQSPGLKMSPGQQIPVRLLIDRRPPFFGTAYAVDATFATLVLPDFAAALTALQKGRTLVVESAVGRGVYDLTGTFKALNGALDCAVRNLHYATNPAASPSPSPAAAPSAPPLDRTLLFQLATGLITDLGMTDFVYLSQQETSELFTADAVAWRSPSMGVLGSVIAVPANGIADLKDTDGDDFAFLAKNCGGEVATTARKVSVTENNSRELRAICVEDGNTRESFLNKTLVGDTVVYTWLVFDQSASVKEPVARQALSEKAAIRAASFIRE